MKETQSKLLGDLRLVSFQSQAIMLKLQYVLKNIENHSFEWVVLAKQLIHDALKHEPFRKETKYWSS
jgi:hypothetical protein